MIKLKNNYTTPEQSKRLLELGVLADSADLIFYHTPDSLCDPYVVNDAHHVRNLKVGKGFPCWSVGRLIEIFLLCTPYKDIALNTSDLVEQMVISLFMVNKDGLLDFSKLEKE